MKTKISILSLILLLSATFPIVAQSLGDKVYKEVTVDGKRVNKWVILDSFTDYDEKGKEIHGKNTFNSEFEFSKEYDSNGNIIHEKIFSDYELKFEQWYEYDSKGNLIHKKNSYGIETWYKYNSKGDKIYVKNFDGNETWYEYDQKGKIIHKKNPMVLKNGTNTTCKEI